MRCFCFGRRAKDKRTPIIGLNAKFMEPILVWEYYEAPEELQISTNGGDEDWIAEVPPSYKYTPSWIESSPFGICCTDRYDHPTKEGWTIFIGSHA